jgi:glycolate oxidase subunit GlcD
MSAVVSSLARAVGSDVVFDGDIRPYLSDETETRNLKGSCLAVVRPASLEAVASIVCWADQHEVALVPRGGGTGYAGGAVPFGDSIVVSLERLNRVRSFDPLYWRMQVEAGVTTHRVQQLARENGLYFPPDPGAGEQSHIGGNIATNAGGPHAFKYSATGAWVTGIEAVIPPGDVVTVGGAIRKDVAGYDIKHLLIGSEGTLGIITAAWLRLIPLPEVAYPVAALYRSVEDGTAAIEAVVGNGLLVAALEFVDSGALVAAPPTFFDVDRPSGGFAVIAEVDGTATEAAAMRSDLFAVLSTDSIAIHSPREREGVAALWRWREGMTGAVTAQRGGKVSEDILVPFDRLAEAVLRTRSIGAEVGLPACSWGHAGDGNLHSTFLIDRTSSSELRLAERATEKLFELALELGGSISGEHGVGLVKSGHLDAVWPGRGAELHAGIKALFDPKNLMNPGKKQ